MLWKSNSHWWGKLHRIRPGLWFWRENRGAGRVRCCFWELRMCELQTDWGLDMQRHLLLWNLRRWTCCWSRSLRTFSDQKLCWVLMNSLRKRSRGHLRPANYLVSDSRNDNSDHHKLSSSANNAQPCSLHPPAPAATFEEQCSDRNPLEWVHHWHSESNHKPLWQELHPRQVPSQCLIWPKRALTLEDRF